uniref:BRO1 domain-containing protein n=1 Tax=Cyclophora tenuis TaxID=216820 RepID=A0A7S1D1J9_CYCTE
MLIIPLKASTRCDLKAELIKWLDGPDEDSLVNPMAYVSVRPDFKSKDCYKEIQRLASLRNCLSDAITIPNSHKHALDDFALKDSHEYHAALLQFEKHGFPTTDEVSNLKLEWRACEGGTKECHGSLVWDRGCTLWNIGALESFMASIQPHDKEGRKLVVKHSQNASAAMVYLQSAVQGQTFEGVDLSLASIKFWEKAMLAQAQMAAYEMASSSSKHALQSYLAMGAVGLWNEALTLSQDPLLVSALPKLMLDAGVQCKAFSMMLAARAEYHQAMESRGAKDWGVEIARLETASDKIKECIDFYRKSDMEVAQVEAIQRFIDDRKDRAIQENRLFGEEVPKSLPPIQAHVVVKSNAPMPESMTKTKIPMFVSLRRK